MYCPSGASAPTPVTAGYYSIGTPGTRSGQSACPAGRFCQDGVSSPCGPGRYGNASELTACFGPCPAGSYCSGGTVTPAACGSPSVYCPAGASQPTAVQRGYYSTNPVAGLAAGTGMTAQAPCQPGYYCVNGSVSACPAGTVQPAVLASAVTDCVPCSAGYYCGRWAERSVGGRWRGRGRTSCCGGCVSTAWLLVRVTRVSCWAGVGCTTALPCGGSGNDSSLYCPSGAAAPVQVVAMV